MSETVKLSRKTTVVEVAGLLWLVRIITPAIPITVSEQSYTLGQAHALCTSAIGTLAQAFSNTAASNCAKVATLYDLLNVITVAAIAFTVWAVVLFIQSRRVDHDFSKSS